MDEAAREKPPVSVLSTALVILSKIKPDFSVAVKSGRGFEVLDVDEFWLVFGVLLSI